MPGQKGFIKAVGNNRTNITSLKFVKNYSLGFSFRHCLGLL